MSVRWIFMSKHSEIMIFVKIAFFEDSHIFESKYNSDKMSFNSIRWVFKLMLQNYAHSEFWLVWKQWSISFKTLTRDSLIQDLNNLEERVAEKIRVKDEEISDLKTENRDQKKEIEDIRAERDLYLKSGVLRPPVDRFNTVLFDRYMNPCWKQYRLIGRENRDQKKEIESLKARLNSVATENSTVSQNELGSSLEPAAGQMDDAIIIIDDNEQVQLDEPNSRLAQMDFRNDSEMLPPPLIPIDDPANPSPIITGNENTANRPRRSARGRPRTRTARANIHAESENQSKMSHVLQKPSPWKCTLCSGYFHTIDYLRDHIKQYHRRRRHFCRRCPFSSSSKGYIDVHEQDRDLYYNCILMFSFRYLWIYMISYKSGMSKTISIKMQSMVKNANSAMFGSGMGSTDRSHSVWIMKTINYSL